MDLGRIAGSGPLSPLEQEFFEWLSTQHLIAHHAFFDIAVLERLTGGRIEDFSCTKLLYKLLASEGFFGQEWGLKSAMQDLLRWSVNTDDLNAWLKANKKKKSEMSDAPFDILGRYNQLDAAATWELYKLFRETIEANQEGWAAYIVDYLREAYSEYRQILDVNHTGIPVDMEWLTQYTAKTEAAAKRLLDEFLSQSQVAPHIQVFNETQVKDLLSAEPAPLTKTGKPAANHLKWQAKVQEAKVTQHFNVSSNDHLSWLFYERVHMPVKRVTDKGNPAVDKKALELMGGPADKLLKYRKERDLLKFLHSLASNIIDGAYRPQYRLAGTLTQRLSCGADN